MHGEQAPVAERELVLCGIGVVRDPHPVGGYDPHSDRYSRP